MENSSFNHGSLFSGIGGFDLAAEWVGWNNFFHCENNAFCKQVLKYYWPNAISYDDIKQTDFSVHRGRIDVLTGGFPCQPYSTAGKRLGKEDERHLWPEMLRAIREIAPPWVVGENVRGLTNWNGGLVFDEVQSDLESEGYEVQPFLLPAAGVGAPHERYRIWFVAYSRLLGQEKRQEHPMGFEQLCEKRNASDYESSDSKQYRNSWNSGNEFTNLCKHEYASDTMCGRQSGKEYRKTESGWIAKKIIPNDWQNFPTQSPVCTGNDGISSGLDGITFPKWRNESIKAAGNAIVPQVVYQIFKAINEYEKINNQ